MAGRVVTGGGGWLAVKCRRGGMRGGDSREYPFVPLRLPGADWAAIFFRLRFLQEFDLWLNALAYIPMGLLACLYFRRAHATKVAIVRAIAFSTAFSLTMELCQFFIPFRVANIADVVANGVGAAVGACAFIEPIHAVFTRPVGDARERIVIAGGWGDAGLMLCHSGSLHS